ncbi:hypothetical protein ACFL6I_05750 [candidate division KSB1 bacterium]
MEKEIFKRFDMNQPLDPRHQNPEDWDGEPPKTVREFYERIDERRQRRLKRYAQELHEKTGISMSPDNLLDTMTGIREALPLIVTHDKKDD